MIKKTIKEALINTIVAIGSIIAAFFIFKILKSVIFATSIIVLLFIGIVGAIAAIDYFDD